MPCYNVQNTVDEAISSLLTQSLTDFEVVAVDDGSTDGTLKQLQQWAQRDQRVKVVQLAHQGIINALNAGIKACTAAYIARMDADDRSTPDRLMRQVKMLDEKLELAVVSSLVRGFPDGNLGSEFLAYINWLNSLLSDEDIKWNIFVQSPLAHPSVTYRRKWVEKIGGYQDHGWAEDYDLWVRLFLAGANFGKVNQVLLEWRDHPQRLTHTDGRYSPDSDLRLKAHYLLRGPLSKHKNTYIWGMGNVARQLGEQLMLLGCTNLSYIESNPMLGETSNPHSSVISAKNFFERYLPNQHGVVLVEENDQNTMRILKQKFEASKLHPGIDWFTIAL